MISLLSRGKSILTYSDICYVQTLTSGAPWYHLNMIPKTRLGRWSTKLIVVFFSCFAAFQLLLAFGQRPGETFFSNPILSVVALLMGTAGVLAFVTGATSIFRDRERSIFVFLYAALGLFVLIFWLGEIFVPH